MAAITLFLSRKQITTLDNIHSTLTETAQLFGNNIFISKVNTFVCAVQLYIKCKYFGFKINSGTESFNILNKYCYYNMLVLRL